MTSSLAPVQSAGIGSFSGYQPNNNAAFSFMSGSHYGLHGQNSALRSFSSSGSYGGRSRPESPATGDLLSSSGYEAYPTPGAPTSLPPAAPPSGSLPAIGQGNTYQYNHHLGGAPSQNPINSQPQPSGQDQYSPPGPYYPSAPYHHQSLMSPTTPTSSTMSMSRPMSAGQHGSNYPPPLQPLQPQPYRSSFQLPGMILGMGQSTGIMTHHHHPGVLHHPQQDRPFKCDECPQSFSRNHDLKRHKRIHLAIKPFPCDNCEKSFSRKDALKRHRLVKGCGKASDAKAQQQQQQQQDQQQQPHKSSQDQQKQQFGLHQHQQHHSQHHSQNQYQHQQPQMQMQHQNDRMRPSSSPISPIGHGNMSPMASRGRHSSYNSPQSLVS